MHPLRHDPVHASDVYRSASALDASRKDPFARVFHFGELAVGPALAAIVVAFSIHAGGFFLARAHETMFSSWKKPVEVEIEPEKEEPKVEEPKTVVPEPVETAPQPTATTPPPPPPQATTPPPPPQNTPPPPPPPPLGSPPPLLAAKGPAEPGEKTWLDCSSGDCKLAHGVVGPGGTSDVGLPGGKPNGVVGGTGTTSAPPPKPVQPAPPPKPVVNLSRQPKANFSADACKGYYPPDADEDAGQVSVLVMIGADGKIQSAKVIAESPQGQGFGAAARTCLLSGKTFTPALDQDGNPVASPQNISIHFTR